jgi:UDP-N-acetylglucosamine acyltransferase
MKTLIHQTAVIHPDAQLDSTVEVGAYAVIGDRVTIGAGTTIGAHAVIEGPTEIGTDNRIFAGAAIGMEPQDLKYKGAPSLVKIGNGNCIREYVTINRATDVGEVTRIGDRNLLMSYVHVAHNCHIEDLVVIASTVALAGHVHIESQAVIGGVSGIHQFVHIGKLAMVGGMTKIVRDVPPYMLVEGYPAQVRSLNLLGLKRAGFTSAELAALKSAFRTLYRSELSLNEALEKIDSLSDSDKLQHLRAFLQASQQAGRRGLIPGKRMKHGESGE